MGIAEKVAEITPEQRKELLNALKDTSEFRELVSQLFGEEIADVKGRLAEVENAVRKPVVEKPKKGFFDNLFE